MYVQTTEEKKVGAEQQTGKKWDQWTQGDRPKEKEKKKTTEHFEGIELLYFTNVVYNWFSYNDLIYLH